jgi:hypothetical protein
MTGSATVTLPGAVKKIVKSEVPRMPETAQIAFKSVNPENNIITIQNTLTDKNGHEVHLSQGTDVKLIIEAGETSVDPLKPWPDMFGEDDVKR